MRKLSLLLLWLIGGISMSAGEVTEQEALQIAHQFLQGKSFQSKSLRRSPTQNVEQFYVFNAEEQSGFVIVSADDRTVPVLGYSDRGSLDYNNLPNHVKAWLDSYADQIKMLGANDKSVPRRAIGAPITPLVSCHWNQGNPYNSQCPLDGSNQSVTGCVATAMAQLMYYHRWPQDEAPALEGYTTSSVGIKVDALPATTFQWDKMKDNYAANEIGESVDAMAVLMRYCGQSVHMDYTSNESGANVYASDLTEIYGYSKTAKLVTRADYTTTEWEVMIYNELANERPVLYSGRSDTSGHQFIIDGYDNNGLFHVNWGWGGSADGYFVLSILNPDGRGIGGGMSSNGFTEIQDAIIGVQPNHGEEMVMPDLFTWFSLSNITEYSRASTNEDFTAISVQTIVGCMDNVDIQFDYAWAICQNGEIVSILQENPNQEIQAGYIVGFVPQLSFGKDLEDGTYELRGLYRLVGTDEWKMCGVTYDIILAVINGTNLILEYASEKEDAVILNNVTLQGDKKEGRPMSVVLNWTNNGYFNENTFYVWLGSVKNRYVASCSGYLDPGETGLLEIAFTPTSVGQEILTITTDYLGQNIIYTETFDVAEVKVQNLVVQEIIIDGLTNGKIEGTTFKATVTLKNQGEYDYDDNVVFRMYPLDEDEYYYYFVGDPIDIVEPLLLPQGNTKQINVSFTELASNQLYYFLVCYYSKEGIVTTRVKVITTGLENIPDNIVFRDNKVKALCVGKWDTNGDGELSKEEAAAVTSLENLFMSNTEIRYFDELQYFTGLSALGEEEFSGCYNLTSIILPNSVTTIEGNAFYECSSLTTIALPSSVKKLADAVFVGCSGLTTITIPAQVEEIGYGNFTACSKLKSIEVDAENQYYLSIDGVLYTKSKRTLIAYPDNKEGTSYTVVDGTNLIQDFSCTYSKLTELTLPESVYEIGVYAFGFNTTLRTINSNIKDGIDGGFRDEVFSEEVYQQATLYVPAGWKERYQAISGWNKFVHIEERGSTDEVFDYDFEVDGIYYNYGTEPQTAVVTYKSIPDRGYSGFVNIPEKVEYNGVEYAVTEINEYTFMDCTGLTKVNIPNSVKYIGRFAFENTGLIEVVIPNSVVEIGPTAFEGCRELTSVILSDNVTKIDEVTFMNCSNLTELVIGNSVTDICMFAFWGCSKLASVTIPNSVVSIASYAFEDCSSLTELVIGNSVAFIGDNAFEDCSSLVSITSLNPTPPEIERFTFDTKTYQTATLHVMTGSKSAYEQAPYWKDFFIIQEDATDGVNSVVTDRQEKTAIYTLDGKQFNTTNAADLPTGIYIINGKKVVVK